MSTLQTPIISPVISDEMLRRINEWAAEHNVTPDRTVEIALENLFATAPIAPPENGATASKPERREWPEFDDPDEEDALYLRLMRPLRMQVLQRLREEEEQEEQGA